MTRGLRKGSAAACRRTWQRPPLVFKTDEGMKIPWRVRFPSASATRGLCSGVPGSRLALGPPPVERPAGPPVTELWMSAAVPAEEMATAASDEVVASGNNVVLLEAGAEASPDRRSDPPSAPRRTPPDRARRPRTLSQV